jgi:hypothetical protein
MDESAESGLGVSQRNEVARDLQGGWEEARRRRSPVPGVWRGECDGGCRG